MVNATNISFILNESNIEQQLPELMKIMLPFFIIMGVILLATYIYFALAMYTTAKKLNVESAGLAWIPLVNFILLGSMARLPIWIPIVLIVSIFVPILNILGAIAFAVFYVISLWRICEYRGKDGWLSLFTFIPFIGGIWNYVLWGLLAWDDNSMRFGNDNTSVSKKQVVKKPKSRK